VLRSEQNAQVDVWVGVQQVGAVAQPAVDCSRVRDEADACAAQVTRRVFAKPLESRSHGRMLA
jgi:hypothetical protein